MKDYKQNAFARCPMVGSKCFGKDSWQSQIGKQHNEKCDEEVSQKVEDFVGCGL
jgi:hypothetical protein